MENISYNQIILQKISDEGFLEERRNPWLVKFEDVIDRRLSPGFGKPHVLANRFVMTRRLAASSETIFESVL